MKNTSNDTTKDTLSASSALAWLTKLPSLDQVLTQVDQALKAITIAPVALRDNPANRPGIEQRCQDLSEEEKREAAALMRVNHVGEVCAQALYQSQAMTTRNQQLRAEFLQAANEEADHLAWTSQRIEELGSRTSLLNPLWYAGAFGLGLIAGRIGDTASLSFMAETENQVEAHLAGHLSKLPAGDAKSRAIVEQMQMDEAMHASKANMLGAQKLPLPVRLAMKGMAKVMTTVAHKI
jgi:ubiquinone biosynthesis monooxygenase Coq7